MSSSEDAAARRAAAAEARRQKILARGAQRLDRITMGAPMASEASEVTANDAAAATTSSGAGNADSNELAPDAAAEPPEPTQPASAPPQPSEAVPLQGEGPTPEALAGADGSFNDVRQCEEAALRAAQQSAEQALHTLLNQLAGSAGGGQFLLHPPHAQQQQQQRRQGQLDSAADGDASSSGRTAAVMAPPALQRASRDAGGDGGGRPGAAAAGRTAGGMAGGAALAVAALLAAVVGSLFGPHLTAAVEGSRRLRCVAALALAGLLFFGVVELAQLRVRPVVALLATQVALISGVGLLGLSSSGRRARLAKPATSTEPAATLDPAQEPGAASSKPVAPPPRFDWLSLVPGLRPLLDRISAAQALASALFGDVAVFLVSYIVLDACSQVAGGRAGAR